MSSGSVITLTTDFGMRDWFVGTIKGVIAGINPRATVVDITHEIPAGDIRAGAFALAASYCFFPRNSVHVVVVDPGVGTDRKAVVVRTEHYFFVGPDNGVLSWALAKEKIKATRVLENAKYFQRPASHTFHGRDMFAPVAAHLSRGVAFQKVGPPLKSLLWLPWPQPRLIRDELQGEILYVDRFGNAITNLDSSALGSLDGYGLQVVVGHNCRCKLEPFYQAVPLGCPVAVLGSSGFLEIAVNGDDAAKRFRLDVGDAVRVRTTKSA